MSAPGSTTATDVEGRRIDTIGMDPLDVLRRVFGHREFRGLQEDAARHLTLGGDLLAVLPTGTGKTVIYAVPALIRPGTAIVVSPLLALMRDQVEALRSRGVDARSLTGDTPPDQVREIHAGFADGTLKMLYLGPERLQAPGLLDRLARARISLTAVDEAHVLLQWGSDFRPEYMMLRALVDRFPGVPHAALTATADARMRTAIKRHLAMPDAPEFVGSFDRANISLTVVGKEGSGDAQLLDYVASRKGRSGIVYRLSRAKVEDTAALLRRHGYDALPYHAGLDRATREANQDAFVRRPGVVVVATIAFGMGIDKPDVRFVCHLDLPASVAHYMQETGRAGRDGGASDAFMAYASVDVAQRRRMIDSGDAPDEVKRERRRDLQSLLAVCEAATCRRQALLATFGQRHPGACGSCDNCLSPPTTYDGTVAARMLLAAVAATGSAFGPSHVVDVLLGARKQPLTSRGHDRLPVYGKGAGLPKHEWHGIVRQMLVAGLVRIEDPHGILKVEPEARPLLEGRAKMTLVRRAGTASAIPAMAVRMDDAERAVFDALREERRRIASAQGVPPYVVFTDATLAEMARRRPSNAIEMTAISGVGPSKLERYGETFLAIVAQATQAGREAPAG